MHCQQRVYARDAGAAVRQGGGQEDNLKVQKAKSRYQLCLFLFRNNVVLKHKHSIVENLCDFSGCANSCNKFVSNRS